jgi:High-affinity nickel-transport protein
MSYRIAFPPAAPRRAHPGRLASGSWYGQSFAAMTARERARLIAMYGVIAGLHVAGFVVLFVFVVPSHYKGLGVGVAALAYTLGLRHAFDADHISAIDNCTRKVLGERPKLGWHERGDDLQQLVGSHRRRHGSWPA